MFETVKNRRTIRKYLPKDINPSLLNDLLEISFRASTMGGMQLYSVIVTRDAEMKEKLSPAHFNQPMVKNAPVVLTFCADFRRFSKWCEQRKAVPGYDECVYGYFACCADFLYAGGRSRTRHLLFGNYHL